MKHAACTIALARAKRAPDVVVVLPAPEFPVRGHGEPFSQDAEAVAAASNAARGEQRAVIDYEHQTIDAKTNGQPAPAAGWVRRFRAGPNGELLADVEWTKRAKRMIQRDEYRYLSPYFAYRKRGREVHSVIHIGLTNAPALSTLPKLAAKLEVTMDDKKLRKLLGLADDATVDGAAVETALAKLGEDAAAKAVSEIARTAGLAEDADADAVAVAAKAGKDGEGTEGTEDPGEWVPRSEFDRLAARLETVEKSAATQDAEALVDEAVKAGKLAPGNRKWGLAYAAKDPKGFAEFAASAPVVVPEGAASAPAPADGLSVLEAKVAREIGVDEADYLAAKKVAA